MPGKHKVFVGDYGRSSTYAMKKRRATEECRVVIPGSDDEDSSSSLSDGCRSETRASSVLPEVGMSDDYVDNCDGDVYDRDEDGGNDEFEADIESLASENIDVDDSFNVDFEDVGSDEEGLEDAYEPLYDRAPISLGESMVAILTFMLCYNLTGSAVCDLLSLISLHLQQPNLLKTSLYFFKKYFRNSQNPIVKHYFCSVCNSSLSRKDSICDSCQAANGVSYFIEIPILNQLQVLFKRRGFYEKLQYRFHRKKINDRSFEDIYDGNVYRELFDNGGILSNPNNIPFTWNTDGVSIFKSSGYQIWPFYLIINELPYPERTKSDNMLLAGLWFGPNKPDPNLFMKPIKEAIREINNGVYLNVPGKPEPIKVKGTVICGTCDLPAKSLFLNMTQYNGKYGCPKCKLRGQSVERTWTYPFERELSLRTDEEMIEFARAATNSTPVFGVKGPTELGGFVHNFIRTTAVDSMHCIFLGVVKRLCLVFFDSEFSDHPASAIDRVDLVDSRLSALTPPSFLQRRPRSIKKHIKYWKANELKAWFFYYSLPILHDILPSEYFEHYSMLVIAIFALHQTSISQQTLEYAGRLLTEFVNRFDVLYGARLMTCNVHQLLHIRETVEDSGPLPFTSCFPFENLNGIIKARVHSSCHPELQICSAVSSLVNLSTLRHQNLEYGSAADVYCSRLSNPTMKMRLKNFMDGVSSVGVCRENATLSVIVNEAFARANIVGRKFVTFSRIRKDNSLYTSQSYNRSIKYDNSCAQYNHDGQIRIGIIHSFVKILNCECLYEAMCECYGPSYAIIRPCTLSSMLSQKLLRNVTELVYECAGIGEQAVAINVEQLVAVCFSLKIADTNKSYVALPANSIEPE